MADSADSFQVLISPQPKQVNTDYTADEVRKAFKASGETERARSRISVHDASPKLRKPEGQLLLRRHTGIYITNATLPKFT